MISLDGDVEMDDTESNQNKTHFDGDGTETPETTTPCKDLLPRTRTDILKTTFSFSGSLAWNSFIQKESKSGTH